MASVGNRVWTVGELLNWTRRYFEGHGVDSPRLTAERLLGHALGCRRIDLYTRFTDVVGEADRARFRDLVRRRAEGVPVAYLTRSVQFLTLTLYVDERVMVPRPETEILVEAFEARVPSGEATVVDVGAGSGVIAVAVACRRPAARVLAIDVSPGALAVAGRNVADHGLADRVALIEGDLLDALAHRDLRDEVNAVLANLPYVSEADLAAAQPEVRDHEPRVALDGGPDGLREIRRLLPQVPGVLAPGGWLLLEIGAGQADDVVALLDAQRETWKTIERVRDYSGHERVIAARRAGTERGTGLGKGDRHVATPKRGQAPHHGSEPVPFSGTVPL